MNLPLFYCQFKYLFIDLLLHVNCSTFFINEIGIGKCINKGTKCERKNSKEFKNNKAKYTRGISDKRIDNSRHFA